MKCSYCKSEVLTKDRYSLFINWENPPFEIVCCSEPCLSKYLDVAIKQAKVIHKKRARKADK